MHTSSREEIFSQLTASNSDFIRTNTTDVINHCINKLNSEEINLCDIVEGLKHFLTNTSPTERALGVQILADILQELSPFKVNTKEVSYLSTFFVDRLKDHHSVVPHVIIGIFALVKQEKITSEDVKALILTLFQEVPCQAQILADRRNIYSLLKFCILNKTDDIKEFSDEFILGFISAVEGEKDPRNLILLFSFFPKIAEELSLKNFAEDLFELVAAYYPIDFVPPKRDDYLVTADDLTLGLRACLACTDAFAPYCIPLIQEKLKSDIVDAKLESLRTLQACCKNYSGTSLRPYAFELWDCLCREVMEGWNMDVEKEVIESIACVVEAMERDSVCSDIVNAIGASALSECTPHLSNPEQRLMFPSTELLLAVSRYSSVLSQTFCEKLIPILVEQFSQKCKSIAKKNTLIVISKFLLRGSKFSLFVAEPLMGYRQASFQCLFEGLLHNEKIIKEASILGFKMALDVFTVEEVTRVGGEMAYFLTANEFDHNFRNAIIDCLTCIGRKHPSVLTASVFPSLLGDLEGQIEKRENLKNILDAISALCRSTAALKEALPPIWVTILKLVLLGDELVIVFLQCLKASIMFNENLSECLMYLAHDWKGFIKCQLLALICIHSKFFSDPIPILEEICCISQMLVTCVNVEEVLKLSEIFCGKINVTEAFPDEVAELVPSSSDRIVTFFSQTLVEHSELMVYFVRCFLLRDDSHLKEVRQEVGRCVLKWSLTEGSDSRISEKASSSVALYILYIPTSEELELYLSVLKEELNCLLTGNDKFDGTSNPAQVLGWIVKGLIMRGYPNDHEWVILLLKLLKSDDIGKKACECYKFLLRDDDSLFILPGIRPKMYRLLYRQRFFENHIEEMVNQFKELGNSKQESKYNVLLAILHLLPHLPQAVLKGHLKKLLPILVIGLNGCSSKETASVTAGAVETLSFLLSHNVQEVIPHLSALIPSLLKLGATGPVNVRVKSLECLETLTELQSANLMSYKKEVLQQLKVVLNDRKRVVRRAGALARAAWILL